MFNFLKCMFFKEPIPQSAIEHSSKGTYSNTNKLKSGGHGQEAINYMTKNNIEFNINKTYSNGVRVGNVPKHKEKLKRSGNNQSWFPQNWDRSMIKNAGQSVAKGIKLRNGKIKTGTYKKVKIGIIRTNGKIATIFPLNKQK